MSDAPDIVNTQQADYWSSEAAPKWISHQAAIDASLAPVAARVLERAGIEAGHRVLDIGCGAGATLLSTAPLVGDDGHVDGADISAPLLERSRERLTAAGITNFGLFVADAQSHKFEHGCYDRVVSRFGVMFFADPVAAFANIRTALKPGGVLSVVAWAALNDNPWFSVPRAAAIARLGPVEPADPTAPGPLAFQDSARVVGILRDAGFEQIQADAEDIALTPNGSVEDVAALACKLGPAQRIIAEHEGTPADEAAIQEEITRVLAPHATSGGVTVPARLNFFSAVNP